MLEYGTKVLGGVTPGRGGANVWGLSVYNTVKEAIEALGPIDFSLVVVPGLFAKDAALEAIDAGIKVIQMSVERVPLHDALHLVSYAKKKGCSILGPGCGGMVSPGKASTGLGAGEASVSFKPGPVGVLSRSGGQTTTISYSIAQAGLGVSTAIHIGAEPIVGLPFSELLPLFEKDEETQALAMFGEIGTVAEEEAAEVIKEGKFTKPVVAYIAGRTLPTGMRYSHASAIVERGRGGAESKVKAFKEAGVEVVDRPEQIAQALVRILKR